MSEAATPDTPAVHKPITLLVPDAGPLITLAYAQSLDLLLKPGWPVAVVDMVVHEVTRQQTPTSQQIASWLQQQRQQGRLEILQTRVYERYQAMLQQASAESAPPRKAHLGEMAVQEALHQFALDMPPRVGVFLFEDHKIAKPSFVIPQPCQKVSTRAYLLFLEQRGLIESAVAVERQAIAAGRTFSALRFP